MFGAIGIIASSPSTPVVAAANGKVPLYDVPVIPTLPRLDEKQFMAADIVYGLELGKVSDRRLILNKDFYKSTKEIINVMA